MNWFQAVGFDKGGWEYYVTYPAPDEEEARLIAHVKGWEFDGAAEIVEFSDMALH